MLEISQIIILKTLIGHYDLNKGEFMKSLVGYTGFVGSNLYLYNNFNGLYLSMFKVKI